MKVLDLFAGIGGFTLGLERAGFETVAFCEIDPYAQKVLRKNWPEVPIYDDVRTITAERLAADGIRVDVITGGFPCQDISLAGHQAGIEGERSGLWTECARLLGELQPRYAIFENVTNLLNGERGAWFKRVLWDISALGYDAEWHCIPASALGAHHHRDRVWIIAYSSGQHGRDDGQLATDQAKRPQGTDDTTAICQNLADANDAGNRTSERETNSITQEVVERREKQPQPKFSRLSQNLALDIGNASNWIAKPDVGRVAHGVPDRSHRLKCLGNAVVPPIPELIGRAIKNHEL